MENIKDTTIHWPAVRIIAHPDENSMNEVLVPLGELNWNPTFEEERMHLTLEEIAEQLDGLGYSSPYYVWYELGLSGTIYMYGNYTPKEWVKHGTTRGYA